MNRFSFNFLIAFCFTSPAIAQLNLKPFIGLDSLPTPATPICGIPNYLGAFYDSGLQEGDTIPDFQLYDIHGAPFHIATALSLGKPVLLVNSSYTCPVFRGKIPVLNQIVAEYGNQVTICVIYTVEAHPNIDISPYFGIVNTGSANINAGILYQQPTTYAERLEIVEDMLNALDINAPIYIDGPCNEWWLTFGPAPNNAYLISPEGIVVAKHGWFHRSPDDMLCDIEQYLQPGTNCDNSSGNFGQFTFKLLADTIAYGSPGDGIFVEALLENPSPDPVNIEIKRMIENVPPDWATAMCIDICYSTETDYTTIQIPAGESQLFIMDFFTSPDVIAQGMVQIGFRNLDHPQNKFVQKMYGSTDLSSDTEGPSQQINPVSIFPQPAANQATIGIPIPWLTEFPGLLFRLFDRNGRSLATIAVSEKNFSIDRGLLPAGAYPFQIISGKKIVYSGELIFQ